MTFKFFVRTFKLFNIMLFCVAQMYAMEEKITHITDLVQINQRNGNEFICKSDLVNRYKKYCTIDGKQIYRPHTWNCFTQISENVRHGIIKDYYDMMTHSLLQNEVGQTFLMHFKNYYKTRKENKRTDFEILRSNIQELLYIKKLYETVPSDAINIIWSQIKQEFVEHVEDIWSKQLKETDLHSDIHLLDFQPTSVQYIFENNEPFFDPIILDGHTIEPFYSRDFETKQDKTKIRIKSPEGVKTVINIVEDYFDMSNYTMSTLCLHGSILGCINGHQKPSFSAYNIKTSVELFTGYEKYKPVKACDIAYGVVALLIGNKFEDYQNILILSTITNRLLFNSYQSAKIGHMGPGEGSRFKLALQTEKGDILLRGKDFASLESPFNPFEALKRLHNDEKISLLEWYGCKICCGSCK